MTTSPATATERLDALTAGATDWLSANLPFFDPFSPQAQASPHGKVKAALELGLLRHIWSRNDPGDDRLAPIDSLVRRLWVLQDFYQLIVLMPSHAGAYELIYAAVTPDGIDQSLRDATLGLLKTDGYLTPAGKSRYLQLETSFYASKAGAAHELDPWAELVSDSILVNLPGEFPLSLQDSYTLTHSSFYLSDFASHRPDLAPSQVDRAADVATAMLGHCAEHDLWDLTAEFMITLTCLGRDPFATTAGDAAVDCLARAQRPDGVIPGRSAAQMPSPDATPGELFHATYHTTIAVILMEKIVSFNRGTHAG